MKPLENRSIYYVFSTSDLRFWCHFLTQTNEKTDCRPSLQNGDHKPEKINLTHKNRLPNGSPNPSKINENPTLDPKVSPLVSLCTHGSPTWSPKGKNQAPKVPKWSLKVSKIKVSDQTIIHVTNQLVNSYLLTGGRRQGRSLKISAALSEASDSYAGVSGTRV